MFLRYFSNDMFFCLTVELHLLQLCILENLYLFVPHLIYFPLILLQGMKLANYMLGLDVYLINAVLLEHQHLQDKAWKGFLQLLLMPLQPEVSFSSTTSHATTSITFELK